MKLQKRNRARVAGCVAIGVMMITNLSAQPGPAAIPVEQFVKLHNLIKPQAGELRFHEIPWQIDVWEARKQAAAEGKPILVWSGAGGAPIGVC